MANSCSSDEDDDTHKKHFKRHKKQLERELKALETALEKQEGRLSHLKSGAFQLANYYFVFQGVILTALCNRSTALRCSDSWFLGTLSAIAAVLNLAALVSIGGKYNRMITQQARTWNKCNDLQGKLSDLEEQENQQQQFPSRNLSGLSGRGSLDAANSSVKSRDEDLLAYSTRHVWDYVDTYDIMRRRMYFGVCILIFLCFAVVVFVGCLKFLCRDKDE